MNVAWNDLLTLDAMPLAAAVLAALTCGLIGNFLVLRRMAMMGDAKEGLNSWMLLGAIVETPDGRWFFKLTGPQGSVESVRTSFDELLTSIHAQERS